VSKKIGSTLFFSAEPPPAFGGRGQAKFSSWPRRKNFNMLKISKILILVLFLIGIGFVISQSKTIKLPLKILALEKNESFGSMVYTVASPSGPKIESKIYEELTVKDEVRVIVMLKEDLVTSTQKLTKKEESNLRKEKIKENQDRVLLILSKLDFKLKNRYRTINAFSGFVTKNGLNRLEKNLDVERVYLDRIAYASLSESIPLINADDVWSSGYTGSGQAVCIIDTGVDYYHEDLGDPACGITIDGTIEPYSLESDHPYSDDFDSTWTITKSGYSNIAVHFSSIELEKGYDFLYVLDANDNILQEFGRDAASYNDVWSVSIPGDTIKVRLVTDYIITQWGFAIDQVLDGVVSTWTNCGQVIGGYDFVNEDDDPMDDAGHGPRVAGIVASQNPTYKGVAPGASIVAAKALDSTGSGWFTDIAAAIDWCADNKDTYGISIISMSLGDGTENDDPATQCDGYLTANAIEFAKNLGIITFVASGNEAYTNGINYPACASAAVSVGASYDADVGRKNWMPTCKDDSTYADKIVCFTNRDEILDLLAPGCETTSLKLNGGTITYCGTSMSAPHVAGAAALLLEADSNLTPTYLKDTLKNTGVSIYDSETGLTFPRIDIKAALDSIIPAVSISLTTDGLVDFGTVPLGETVDSLNDVQTVKIDVGPANLDVKSTIFCDNGNCWNLDSTNEDNQVIWEYSKEGTSWDKFLVANNLYPLDSNVPQTETRNLYLRLTMPTATASSAQYSSTVTIVATAP